jgi:hypothetical protein
MSERTGNYSSLSLYADLIIIVSGAGFSLVRPVVQFLVTQTLGELFPRYSLPPQCAHTSVL